MERVSPRSFPRPMQKPMPYRPQPTALGRISACHPGICHSRRICRATRPRTQAVVTASNAINVYPANNTLVVTDYADNIKRLEKVIATIEQGGSDNTAVFRLKHMAATDAASLLFKLVRRRLCSGNGRSLGSARQSLWIRRAIALSCVPIPVSCWGASGTLLNEIDQAPWYLEISMSFTLKNAEAAKLPRHLRAILSGDASLGELW
jgi:general secretion pathway protein D